MAFYNYGTPTSKTRTVQSTGSPFETPKPLGSPGNIFGLPGTVEKQFYNLYPNAPSASEYKNAQTGGQAAYQNWVSENWQRFWNQYNAWNNSQPAGQKKDYVDWLLGQDTQSQYANLTPYERRETPGMFRPFGRWIR